MTDRLKSAIEASRVLREARQFLSDKRNWVKQKYWDGYMAGESSHVCALGAIALAATPMEKDVDNFLFSEKAKPAINALASVLPMEPCRPHESIFKFNDNMRTTHEDVLAAFDLAIEGQCKIVQEASKTGEDHD